MFLLYMYATNGLACASVPSNGSVGHTEVVSQNGSDIVGTKKALHHVAAGRGLTCSSVIKN